MGGKVNDFSLFCPASPGGQLAAKWKKVVDEVRESSGGLIRGYVAEKSGIPLSALLYNNQLWEKDHCGKEDCNPCRSGTTKRLSCRKVSTGGMVYSCCCLTCRQAVELKESWYHGRSARTLYTRQGEHNAGFQAGNLEIQTHYLFSSSRLRNSSRMPPQHKFTKVSRSTIHRLQRVT